MKSRLVSLFLLALLLFNAVSIQAQKKGPLIKPPRKKVGVVLGGGGAKGAAHIGVLKYLEEQGIPIDYVAGTSMGSIIGGLYAMGYTPDELTQLIAEMNWSEYIGNKIDRSMMSEEARHRNSTLMLNVPFSLENLFNRQQNMSFISQLPSAYVNNSSLVNLFNDLCIGYEQEMDFNDLPIPFACVATDMITGEEVVLRSGNVPNAMRASMAIPGVFSPVTYGDKVLVDGGLVNNFPADVLREMGADIIIGVEITSTKEVSAKDLKSLPQLFGRLVVNSTNAKRGENRAMCRVHIIPDISGYGTLSFTPEAIDTLVQRGYKRASEFHDQLISIKREVEASAGHPVSKVLRAPRAKNLANDSVLLRSITINNVNDRQSRWLMRKGDLKAGSYYTKDDLERAIKVYRGTGCFDEITYLVKEADSIHFYGDSLAEIYDLTVNMIPAKPNVFGLGVRYDTEDGAALLFNVGLNAKRFGGSKLDFSIRLSYNPRMNLTYTYSRSSLANFSLAYDYWNEHFSILVDKKPINLHYQQQKVSGYISQFHLLNYSTNVGLAYSNIKYDLGSAEENSTLDSLLHDNKMIIPFANFTYDNLDDAYFASHGISTNLATHFYYDMEEEGKFFDFNYAFSAYITPKNGRFTFIPQVYGRISFTSNPDNSYLNLLNLYGSEIANRHFEGQMPFIGIGSIGGNSSSFISILRCDLRYNFYGKHYLTAMYNILANWSPLFYGNFTNVFAFTPQGAGLKYSYNSRLGPISLTYHWMGNHGTNHHGAYFSFGYTF